MYSNNTSDSGDSVGWFTNKVNGTQHQAELGIFTGLMTADLAAIQPIKNRDGFVFYGFAGVEGYSKFGSYTGNLDDDGPFIYTGFRPAFVMLKKHLPLDVMEHSRLCTRYTQPDRKSFSA